MHSTHSRSCPIHALRCNHVTTCKNLTLPNSSDGLATIPSKLHPTMVIIPFFVQNYPTYPLDRDAHRQGDGRKAIVLSDRVCFCIRNWNLEAFQSPRALHRHSCSCGALHVSNRHSTGTEVVLENWVATKERLVRAGVLGRNGPRDHNEY